MDLLFVSPFCAPDDTLSNYFIEQLKKQADLSIF